MSKLQTNGGAAILWRLAGTACLVLAGCAHFDPQPLDPAANARSLEARSLTNAGLRVFLERNRPQGLPAWPPPEWDLNLLNLAAWYYSPSLEVARAQLAAAQGAEVTAGQRPNPSLTVTPGYDTTISTPSPWLPAVTLDIPIETAGKRGYRRAEARQLSEAARWNIAGAAWQVRSKVRLSLLERGAAREREQLLRQQVALGEQIVAKLEDQRKSGAISGAAMLPNRIALQQARVQAAEARRAGIEAESRLAESVGVSLRALAAVALATNAVMAAPLPDLAPAELRKQALLNRSDIRSALAEYAAAESALQLAIARQYPDVRMTPGYQYDTGENKWTLGLSIELPVLHQNQGPIAEARARRAELAARFTALQARVLAEVDGALASLQATRQSLSSLDAAAEEQARRRDLVRSQVKAGAAEPLELATAEIETLTIRTQQADSRVRLQQAVGALEDACQKPLFEGADPASIPTLESHP